MSWWTWLASSDDLNLRIFGSTKNSLSGVNEISVFHDSSNEDSRVLLVKLGIYKESGECEVTGIVCGSFPLTKKVGAVDSTSGLIRCEVWYLVGVPEGESTVTASLSSVADRVDMIATTWLDCVGLGDASDSDSGNLDAISLSLVTQSNRSKLDGSWAGISARIVTPGDGVELIDNVS
jgi:hypothetical protein